MDIQEIKEMFVEEANEYLEVLDTNLELMKTSFDSITYDLICETYRAAHSIKGTSGFLALTEISALSRAMEFKMMPWRDKESSPQPEDILILIEANQILKSMVENFEELQDLDLTDILEKLKN